MMAGNVFHNVFVQRSYFKALDVFRCSNKRYLMAWSHVRWCFVSLNKSCAYRRLQKAYCLNTGGYHVQDMLKSAIKNSDGIIYAPDMVKVKTIPFNLIEGGKSIVDIVKNSTASVVLIFVRTTVLARELVEELKENNFNAKFVDESFKFDISEIDQHIFVVSDMMASKVSLPAVDQIIQVQAPLSGLDVMKQRLHINNFNNAMGKAVLLYNSNDVNFIKKLGQIVEVTSGNSLSTNVSTEEEKQMITKNNEVTALREDIEKSLAVSRRVKTTLFRPEYPRRTKNDRTSFVDRVRLYVIGGSGGNGSPRTGARGGDGGDVMLECHSRASLRHFRFKENRRPKASHGQHCCTRAKRVNGERGEDLIIPVPLGTIVKDEATGHVIADMDKVGQQVKVVSGGRGGSPMTTAGGGEKGQRRMIILEYKMYNDVGLVGFPNAGKSTLLRVISNAKPKVADYAFTSLSPTLGRMELDDYSQLTLADLPGLIEGAHQNKGLGLKFLRHVERTRILMFVVDVNGFQLSSKHPKRTAFETICLLTKELLLYKEGVLNKPKILVLNKMDCAGAEDEYGIIREKIEAFEGELTSDLTQSGTGTQHDMVPKDFHFDYVLAVSALHQTGIDTLMSKLHELIRELKE